MPQTQQSEPDASELKAGHPPAVKVGGMRVSQRSHSISSNHSDKNEEEKQAGGDGAEVPSACSFAPKSVVKQETGGATEKVVSSVPDAVKQFHEKPQPKHDNHAHNNKPNMTIQQPKK